MTSSGDCRRPTFVLPVLLIFAALLFSPLQAQAAVIFTYSFGYNMDYGTGSVNVTGAGTLTGTGTTCPAGSGLCYLIDSITGTGFMDYLSGTDHTYAVTGVLTPGTFNGNNNYLYYNESGLPYFDNQGLGLSFLTDSGTVGWLVLTATGGAHQDLTSGNGYVLTFTNGSVNIAAPEPATTACFGMGLLALAAGGRYLGRRSARRPH